jgi:predicted DNA-binding transcriptional regulator AlpA
MPLHQAVYFTKDIQKLFGCGANEVPRLVAEGTVPRPLPSKAGARKRWAKATVDRWLGLTSNREELRQVVAEELMRLLEATRA